jgi:hypothetical protein
MYLGKLLTPDTWNCPAFTNPYPFLYPMDSANCLVDFALTGFDVDPN